MVWTFGMLALRKSDLQEFFAEFFRFTMFTGFYWWLLQNGPKFGLDIINSMRSIGGEATGLGPNLTPSNIADIGMTVFFKTIDAASLTDIPQSLMAMIIGLGVALMVALIATNMLIQLITAWVLLYAGVFFLGFGGSRWTSDIAINYFKTVLATAASLFAMVLLVGVATDLVNQYYASLGDPSHIKELYIIFVVYFTLAMLIRSVPPMIAGIVSGGSVWHAGNSAFGGSTMGSAATTLMGAGMAGAVWGGKEMIEKFKKGGEEPPKPEENSLSQGASSESASPGTGKTPLADAMGD